MNNIAILELYINLIIYKVIICCFYMQAYNLIDTTNINEARNQIEKAFKQGIKAIVVAKDDEFNRKILENKKVDVLLFGDFKGRKDRLKQRDSGLNHVLCKLAKDNNIAIGLDFSEIKEKTDFVLADYLGRLMQNIKLCSKYKIKIVLFNAGDKNKHDLFSLLMSLGMPTSTAKYAVDNTF